MERKTYKSQLMNAVTNSKLWFFIAVALLLSNIATSAVAYKLVADQQTIILPPEVESPIRARRDGRYNREYLQDMADYFARLYLTYQPNNITHQAQKFMKYVAPDKYGALEAQVNEAIALVGKRGYSSVFHPEGYVTDGMDVAVRGMLRTYVGKEPVEERRTAWIVGFTTLPDGRLAVSRFEETNYEKPFGIEARAVKVRN